LKIQFWLSNRIRDESHKYLTWMRKGKDLSGLKKKKAMKG